jgi:hypothetical protein
MFNTFSELQADKQAIGAGLSYTYNKSAHRFADKATGKFLSQSQAQTIVETGIKKNRDRLQTLAENLASGGIDITRFLTDGSDAIKNLHILNAVNAVGNRADALTKDQVKELNRRVKEHLSGGKDKLTGDRFGFSELIKDLVKGNASEAELKNRLNMFADAAALTQAHIKRVQIEADKTYSQALRVLGVAEHCPECVSYAGLSWVKLSDLIMPGDRCSCRANCKCTVVYR